MVVRILNRELQEYSAENLLQILDEKQAQGKLIPQLDCAVEPGNTCILWKYRKVESNEENKHNRLITMGVFIKF